jgi:hypothetical protein
LHVSVIAADHAAKLERWLVVVAGPECLAKRFVSQIVYDTANTLDWVICELSFSAAQLWKDALLNLVGHSAFVPVRYVFARVIGYVAAYGPIDTESKRAAQLFQRVVQLIYPESNFVAMWT